MVILPDNDPPGEGYARDVARILLTQYKAASVKIVHLPGLPGGGDIVEFLEARSDKPHEQIRSEIESLVSDNAPVDLIDLDDSGATPVLLRLADVKPERIRWLWKDRIPSGKLTIIYGDPGLGKSVLTLDLAARISSGLPWPDDPNTRAKLGDVVLLSAEDDVADTIAPRLIAAGADLKRVQLLQSVKDDEKQRSFSLVKDLIVLEKALRQGHNVKLLVIDPISAYLDKTDTHRNSDVRGILAPLSDLAAKYDVAVVAVTHLNKSGQGKALYRATGSLAFVAAARAAYLVAVDQNDKSRRQFLPAKMNLSPASGGLAFEIESEELEHIDSVPIVSWDPDPIDATADDVLASEADALDQDGTKLGDAKAWLLGKLVGGPVATNDLKTQARRDSIAWRTLERAKQALHVSSAFEGSGSDKKWMWCLPDADADKGADQVGSDTVEKAA